MICSTFRAAAALTAAAVLAACTPATNAVFIAGFESGADGFEASGIYTGAGDFATSADGATEGASALQWRTPGGAFVGVQNFSLNQADLIAAAAAGETLLLDLSVLAPNTSDFATIRAGINSDEGFQESADQPVPLDGSIATYAFDLGEVTTIDGDETFAGLILAVNSQVGSDMVFRIDNIRTVVPEPSSLALTLLSFAALRRRRRA